MKRALRILIVSLVVLVISAFAKDVIIKVSVEKAVEIVTGLKLSIQSFKVAIIRTYVDIKNLRLYNPPGYKDRMMLHITNIYVVYDLSDIIAGNMHLPELAIRLKEFVVVKNEKGELNLNSLKVVQAQKEGKKPESARKGKPQQIKIDTLELEIGKVIYKDYSQGDKPIIRIFNINLKERYSNITNPYTLASLIVVKALTNTTIANLTNFDLQGLNGTISDTLATAQKVTAEAVGKATQIVKDAKGTVQTATDTAKKTEEAVKETANVLKDVFKSPFGSDKQ